MVMDFVWGKHINFDTTAQFWESEDDYGNDLHEFQPKWRVFLRKIPHEERCSAERRDTSFVSKLVAAEQAAVAAWNSSRRLSA